MIETASAQSARAYGGGTQNATNTIVTNNNADENHIIALRCTTPRRGYLRLRRHHTLGKALFEESTASSNVPPSNEARWRLLKENEGYVRLMQYGSYLSMIPGEARNMPWMLSISKETTNYTLFKVEIRQDKKSTGWQSIRLFNVGVGAYINCCKAGAIRGHSLGDKSRASTSVEPSTLLEFFRAPFLVPKMEDSLSGVDIDCERTCRGDKAVPLNDNNNDEHVYFPPMAFADKTQFLICPSRFRDMSDWVFSWPFDHFGERIWIAPLNSFIRCTTVPIIYSHANALYKIPALAKRLKQQFVLISGQSDFPVSRYKQLLNEPFLLKWFAQNADATHGKLVQLPIGLNCFEHAEAMHRFLINNNPKISAKKTKLLWVNFANTHPRRRIAWTHFCPTEFRSTPNKQNVIPQTHHSLVWKNAPEPDRATCYDKSRDRKKTSIHTGGYVTSLVQHYGRMAQHKFVAAPRGNGLDTHRFWEALYVGSIPVVESSAIDHLYIVAGALIVKDWTQVTPHFLKERYPEYRARVQNATHLLTPHYWAHQIESARYLHSKEMLSRLLIHAPDAGERSLLLLRKA